MPGPLEGVRIIDWTIWQQGPVATALLSDLGAEVIKIEDRLIGDPGRAVQKLRGLSMRLPHGRNCYFEVNNHNKKGITLNLKTEKGREIAYKLVEKSDVFVQNFRQGVAARLGMDYQTLSQHNPRLIYATASGWGPKGPDSNLPSFDYLGLARSGIMNAIGEPDMPPLSMVGGIADQAGAMMLAYGVLAALVARERLGIGQEIDVSHLGSMITLQFINVSAALLLGREMPRTPRNEAPNPLWNHYHCKDGTWVALAHLQPDRYWATLCKAMGISELIKDPRFNTMDKREENAAELVAILDKLFASKTYEEWDKIFRESGDLIYTSIRTVSDLPNDPQALENEYIVNFDHPVLGKVKMLGVPVRFSKTPGSIRLPAPEFGQHTEEVLMEICGYTWAEIEQLKEEKVI